MSERALVLGGGGSAGNAWLIGVVAGLLEAGLDVTTADLVIGTSAGSTAAAQVTGTSPSQLLAEILSADGPRRGPSGPDGGPSRLGPAQDHMQTTGAIIAAATDAADMRRRLGAAALRLDQRSDDSDQARWRETVARRLGRHDWPEQRLVITAVDARTGEPVSFDRHSGIALVDAVAASPANGFGVPPYRIGDRRYIDGGYRRSSENADLAMGSARVLVLSPLGGRSWARPEWGMDLATQIDELRAGGSRVGTILPDSNARAVFGDDMMNLAARPSAARAGYGQGTALADRLGAFWA